MSPSLLILNDLDSSESRSLRFRGLAFRKRSRVTFIKHQSGILYEVSNEIITFAIL